MADVDYAREHWDEWSKEEKLDWLEDFINDNLDELGYDEVAVRFEEDQYINEYSPEAYEPIDFVDANAEYGHDNDEIVFDENYFENGDFDDVVETALHEMSHAMDWDILTEAEYFDPDDEEAQEEDADYFAKWYGESIGLNTTDEEISDEEDEISTEVEGEATTIEYSEDEVDPYGGYEVEETEDGEFIFSDEDADEALAWWLEESGEEMSEEQAEDIYGDDMSAWLEERGDDLSGFFEDVLENLNNFFNGASP